LIYVGASTTESLCSRRSQNETDAGYDGQRVDSEFELPIREPLEDAQAAPDGEECTGEKEREERRGKA